MPTPAGRLSSSGTSRPPPVTTETSVSGTYNWSGFHGDQGATAQLSAFVIGSAQDSDSGTATATLVNTGAGVLQPVLRLAGRWFRLHRHLYLPGLGPWRHLRLYHHGRQQRPQQLPVQRDLLVPDGLRDGFAPSNTSWQDAQALSVGTQGSITDPGEDLWYEFPVQPGEQVQVSLSNVPADYDISLFSDISQTLEAETSSTPNLAALGAESPGNAASPSAFSPSAFSPSAFSPSAFSPSAFSPSAFSPSAFSPSAFSPSAFSPSAFSPSAFSAAYSDAQIDSLLAVSTAQGAVDKSVTADTWNNTGNFYVRVSGNNGAYSPLPFTISETTSGGACAGVTLSGYTGDGFATVSGGTISGAGGPTTGRSLLTTRRSCRRLDQPLTAVPARCTPLRPGPRPLTEW